MVSPPALPLTLTLSRRERGSTLRSQYRPDADPRLVAGDLLAVAALAAQDLDEAAGAMNRHARGTDLDDLADFLAAHRAEDAGGDLSRIEDLQPLAVDRRPGARRRVAAADDVVGRVDVVGPVDARFRIAHPAFISRVRFVLRVLARLAGEHQVGGFKQPGGTAGRHLRRKSRG